jgi:hypothetical protein
METDKPQHCPECGAISTDGNTCQDRFYQMGFWEMDYSLIDMHHLMVVSYYLQHPSLYSPEGLKQAKELLIDFLENGLSPQQIRQRDHARVDSGSRTFKIKGTPG